MAKQKTKSRAAQVVVKVNAELKRRYAELLRRFKAATNEGAKAWDLRYEAIAEIIEHEPPLYLAGGFSTDADFLEQVVGENPQAVYRNMRVARYASADDVERYTARRIALAISWLETKHGAPLKARTPIDFARLRFPFKRDGKTVTKALADITVAELTDALALLKGQERSSRDASPLMRALDKVLQDSGVKGVTAHVSGKQLVLRLPVEGVVKLAKALTTFVPPKE